MRMWRAALFAAAMMAGSAANAITYLGSFATNALFTNYSFMTDGTLGSLTAFNFTGYDFTVTNSVTGRVFAFDQSNSTFGTFVRTNLTATASDISFDFGGPPNQGITIVRSEGNDYAQFCLNVAFCGDEYLTTSESGNDYGGSVDQSSGVQSIASTGPDAPAPLLGLGLIPALASLGGLGLTRLRRREQQA